MDQSLFLLIEKTRNKNNFYNKVKKSHVGQYSEKQTKDAYNRALKGK